MGESTWSTWNYCASRHRHLATALLQVNEVSESFQTTNALALLCKSGKRQTKPKTVKVESHKKTMLFARGSFSSNLYPTYLLTYSCVLAACSSYKRYSKPSCPNVGFSFTYYVNMTQTMAKGQGAPFRCSQTIFRIQFTRRLCDEQVSFTAMGGTGESENDENLPQ